MTIGCKMNVIKLNIFNDNCIMYKDNTINLIRKIIEVNYNWQYSNISQLVNNENQRNYVHKC